MTPSRAAPVNNELDGSFEPRQTGWAGGSRSARIARLS
jgi:hypothetical protein